MRLVLLIAALVLAGPAQAHDFWLQPQSFRPPSAGRLAATVQIGHGEDREVWDLKPARIVRFESVGARGAVDLRPQLHAGSGPQTVLLAAPGQTLLVMETSPIVSELPWLRFNDYLEEEGLTPAIEARRRSGRIKALGRELYSRRAKALLQTAAGGGGAIATRPLGLTLEIVPDRDPYALKAGEALPIKVLYQGRPLPGALVKLTDLGRDAKPVEALRTDRAGKAVFRPQPRGQWLLNVVWTRPLTGDASAEFETVFSSFSFGYQ